MKKMRNYKHKPVWIALSFLILTCILPLSLPSQASYVAPFRVPEKFVYDLTWTEWQEDGVTKRLSYGDVFHQNEVEQSTYNFEHSDVDFLLIAFNAYEKQAQHLTENKLALPAYEQVLKAAHTFNLLDARGAISVTERAAYIGRIRNLARAVAAGYLESRARLGFPMAPKAWANEVLAQLDQNKKAAA